MTAIATASLATDCLRLLLFRCSTEPRRSRLGSDISTIALALVFFDKLVLLKGVVNKVSTAKRV